MYRWKAFEWHVHFRLLQKYISTTSRSIEYRVVKRDCTIALLTHSSASAAYRARVRLASEALKMHERCGRMDVPNRRTDDARTRDCTHNRGFFRERYEHSYRSCTCCRYETFAQRHRYFFFLCDCIIIWRFETTNIVSFFTHLESRRICIFFAWYLLVPIWIINIYCTRASD